ncbi:uncharacterized protein [Pseudochaenichthys georgianus]|uniref:uncharacterized protein n=1 Tax=Pseudochaenichthys georgianus TaxID=52239 RepID=UPI0039C33336
MRRADRKPNACSCICSCHVLLQKRKRPVPFKAQNVEEHSYCLRGISDGMEEEAACLMTEEEAGPSTQAAADEDPQPLSENAEEQATTVEAKLQSQQRHIMQLEIQLEESKAKQSYCRDKYSASQLSEKVLRMETGLPDRDTFSAVCEYVARFEGSITYPKGWFPKSLSLEDQVFMTLMKLRHHYTHLHLAALFHCGESTVRNVIVTFIEVLHKLLFKDIMSAVPSREKDKTSLPSSFRHIQNCRMIVDCTDIKIAIPKQMDIQKETYSAYRGMHSFKLLLGVAPHAVITYCSKRYPGSTSDKEIVRDSGVLQHFKPGDLILADKGFLIQNILPEGVTVNIPPFLCHGQLTHSEAQATKLIAQHKIHIERANARLKEFRILKFIPSHLRHFADKLVHVCCALVNFQRPLIKEVAEK